MAIGMKLQPAMIFGENMVLQRGKSIPVWGRGAFGETVTVTLGGNTASAPVVDGLWRVELPAMEATWQTDMIIAAEPSGERVEFHRVAVGEVWLAGGQSNMEFRVKYDKNLDELRAAPSDAYLRHFRYPEVSFPAQLDLNTYPTDGVWRPWDSAFNGEFSAAGSYFALQLRKRLGVPVGILSCNYGGTPTSAWIPLDVLKSTPELTRSIEAYDKACAELDLPKYEEAMLNPPKMSPEIAALIDRMMKGEDPETLRPLMMKFMPKPGDPPRINAYTMGPMSCNRPAGLYDNMLTKVAPYPIRGVIWYQGEDDDTRGWSGFYDVSIKALITSWRKLWGIDFPFLQVELAPYEAGGEQDYPLLRRMQRKAADEFDGLHNVCIMDVGERHNIHPRRKKQVGERLALLARKYVYGDDIFADSPRLAEARREGGRIILRFENAGDGLHIEGETVDSLFVTAENETLSPKVTVAGDSIILEDAAIAGDTPVTVRFAEENYCEDNLYGSTGLPAFPFTVVL